MRRDTKMLSRRVRVLAIVLAVVLLAIAGGIVYLVWKKRRAAKQA